MTRYWTRILDWWRDLPWYYRIPAAVVLVVCVALPVMGCIGKLFSQFIHKQDPPIRPRSPRPSEPRDNYGDRVDLAKRRKGVLREQVAKHDRDLQEARDRFDELVKQQEVYEDEITDCNNVGCVDDIMRKALERKRRRDK